MVNLEGGSGEIGSMTRWASLGENWANVSNTPLRYFKNYSYEGGIRTPLIVHWPGHVKNGMVNTEPVHFIDFMATFADLIDVKYPDTYYGKAIVPAQGVSFLPVLMGKDIKRDAPIFWQWSKGKSVRKGNWKLVSWNGEWELYELANDPTELNDLKALKKGKAKALEKLYNDWFASVSED